MQTPDWECADGTLIPLSAMSTEHIRNVRIYLLDGTGELGPMRRTGCSGFTNPEWLRLLDAELCRRSK